jgi:3-phosphoshikimate 1-carboxyvinyltransferase
MTTPTQSPVPAADPARLTVCAGRPLNGTTEVPGDKSISHRAVMLGALANGTSTIRKWLPAGDTLATLNAVRQLGIQIDHSPDQTLTIHGGAFQPPDAPLNLANAGTGLRLLAGIIAGQRFPCTLDGSDQLRRRPMRRITDPLRLMGAQVQDTDGKPPLHFTPAQLSGITYELPIASAQVKSALLLAGLFADGPTTLVQPGPARDHTERMLQAMGAELDINGSSVTLFPGLPLTALDMTIPGDFSSAAFILLAGSIIPDSAVTLTNVGINPTRTGFLDVLQAMGAQISVVETGTSGGDPIAQIMVQSAPLGKAEVSGETVVRMIDEFPALMVAALCATGTTRVRDAAELRVKETDRIAIMAAELRKMGAVITEYPDGFAITGPQQLHGAVVKGHDDHRIAMSLTIAGLVATGTTTVRNADCTADSFPNFARILYTLGANLR